MATVLTVLGAIGTKLMAGAATAGSFAAAHAGTIATALSAGSTIYGGLAANANAKGQAASLQQKGDNEFAAAQREARQRQRETALVISRQRAVAAASGAGASDPTVEAIMGKTQQEGDYNAMMDMYNGIVSRADLYQEAKTVKKEGKQKRVASFLDAGTTIYGDIASRKRMKQEYAN